MRQGAATRHRARHRAGEPGAAGRVRGRRRGGPRDLPGGGHAGWAASAAARRGRGGPDRAAAARAVAAGLQLGRTAGGHRRGAGCAQRGGGADEPSHDLARFARREQPTVPVRAHGAAGPLPPVRRGAAPAGCRAPPGRGARSGGPHERRAGLAGVQRPAPGRLLHPAARAAGGPGPLPAALPAPRMGDAGVPRRPRLPVVAPGEPGDGPGRRRLPSRRRDRDGHRDDPGEPAAPGRRHPDHLQRQARRPAAARPRQPLARRAGRLLVAGLAGAGEPAAPRRRPRHGGAAARAARVGRPNR